MAKVGNYCGPRGGELTWSLTQIDKLKRFKEKTYPKGLIETYKTIIEFRDKFAKQLELKVRDLQQSEASGELPLSLEFLSIEKGELIGNYIIRKKLVKKLRTVFLPCWINNRIKYIVYHFSKSY